MPAAPVTCMLIINCGSSSLKFGIYATTGLQLVQAGIISSIGELKGRLKISNSDHDTITYESKAYKNINAAVSEIIAYLGEHADEFTISAIGHRIVQGGPDHRLPELITDALLQQLHQLVYLAPNHLPGEIEAIQALKNAYPNLPQVACFDTAFHKDMPDHVKYYPLPHEFQKKGLIKYGFHGLSYEYIMHELIEANPVAKEQKTIIAHLGNGASMVAVNNGVGVDTTMGLSPVGGLVMSTRCGDLDPGVLLFLLKEYHLTANQLDNLLSKQSGLKAICGDSDVQELLKAEEHNPEAALALTVFCYQARKFIGALAAAMGGLNALVFTGGIGANSATIRERICNGLEFIGIELDSQANQTGSGVLSCDTSRVSVRAMKTDEEIMIAKHTNRILNEL
jgi:acetate kinase